MVDKPAPAVAEGNAPADGAALLAGVLARYSAVPLPSGDAATLDAYLSRLIRCAAAFIAPISKSGWSMQVLQFLELLCVCCLCAWVAACMPSVIPGLSGLKVELPARYF